jgi:hypothetical protein
MKAATNCARSDVSLSTETSHSRPDDLAFTAQCEGSSRGERNDRTLQTSGQSLSRFGRTSSAGSSTFAGGRYTWRLAVDRKSGCDWSPLSIPQRFRVEDVEAGFVSEAISLVVDAGGRAEQELAILWLRARSSRVRCSNSARVG